MMQQMVVALTGWQLLLVVLLLVAFVVSIAAQFYQQGRFEGEMDGLTKTDEVRRRHEERAARRPK